MIVIIVQNYTIGMVTVTIIVIVKIIVKNKRAHATNKIGGFMLMLTTI